MLFRSELVVLTKQLADFVDDLESVREIISLCGSFLTLRDDTVYFVHQSAKDFLVTKASNEVFPDSIGSVHHDVFVKSLAILYRTLRRDIYNLQAPGYSIEYVAPPEPDPLEKIRYSTIYWVDHLHSCGSIATTGHLIDLQDEGMIDKFLRQKFLYWLEVLSLCKSMPKGVASIVELEALIHVIFRILQHVMRN